MSKTLAVKLRSGVLKYEAETRPHHPLVANFRIAHVLDHLTRSPDTTGDVKGLAKSVLHDGDTSALQPLADALQEQDHPLAKSYNWMNAIWKLHLDAAVGHALDAVTGHHTELGFPDTEARSLAHQYVQNANQRLRRDFLQTGGFVDPGASVAATEAIGILRGQGHSKEDIADSLARHSLRNQEQGGGREKALQPVPDRNYTEHVTRYGKEKVQTHPLIKGYQLERVLTKLANAKTKSGDTVKALAKNALQDPITHLPILADALDDIDHPMGKQGVRDLRNAATELERDQRIRDVANKIADRRYAEMGENAEQENPLIRQHLGYFGRAVREGQFWGLQGPAYEDLKGEVKAAHPDITDEHIDRAALRAERQYHDAYNAHYNTPNLRTDEPLDKPLPPVYPDRDPKTKSYITTGQEKSEKADRFLFGKQKAKTTKRTPIHPMVKGTRLAIVLKELAKTGNDTTKALAKDVLKNGEMTSLAALADHFDEGGDDHPLSKVGYDFRGAGNKLQMDEIVHPLVAAHTLRDYPDETGKRDVGINHKSRALTLIEQMGREGTVEGDADVNELRTALRSKFPDASDTDLHGSLLRLAVKGGDRFRKTPSHDSENERRFRAVVKRDIKKDALAGTTKTVLGTDSDKGQFRDATQFKFSRTPDPKRGDFLTALKRVNSSQQSQLRELAKQLYEKLDLTPVTVRDAVHSNLNTASAGTAHGIDHDGDLDRVRAAAAQYGLASQSPSLFLFHVQDDGPDSVYRVDVRGSGEGLLKQLDKHGLPQRTLIPTRTGYSVLIADPGSQLKQKVQQFATKVGSAVAENRGVGELLGGGDDSRADGDTRASYRSIIRQYEATNNPQPQQQAPNGPPQVPIGSVDLT